MHGPIDYIVIKFKENKFEGALLEELLQASEKGIIQVLDMAVIVKDEEGNTASLEIMDSSNSVMAELASSVVGDGGMIAEDDVEEVGELLEDNTSAGLLIIEQLWAKGLKKAILDAGGELIAEGRIHPDAVGELDTPNKKKGDK